MRKSKKSFGQFLTAVKKPQHQPKLRESFPEVVTVTEDGTMLKETLKAKTVNGKLVFTGGGGAKPPEDPNSTKVATPQAPTANQKRRMSRCTSNACSSRTATRGRW